MTAGSSDAPPAATGGPAAAGSAASVAIPVAAAPSTGKVFGLAWPIAMNAILLQSIAIIDTLLVAPLGEASLAAMGLATGIVGLLLGTLFAFSNATQLIAAQAEGAGSAAALSDAWRAGLAINVGLAVLGTALVALGGDALLARLAPTAEVADAAFAYLRWFVLVIAGVALCQHVTVMLYATGRSRLPFFVNLVELPVNAAASAALIHGIGPVPPLGLKGAAIGSAIAVGLRAVLLFEARRRSRLAWPVDDEPVLAATRAALPGHVRHAVPIAGTFVSATVSTNVCVLAYAQLGVSQFAALTLILPWVKAGSQLVSAWAQATGILVGQLLGRGGQASLDAFVSSAWRAAMWIATAVMVAYLALALSFGRLYANLDGATIDALHSLTPLLLALPWMRTSNTICGNVLRAGGQAAWSLKVHAGTQWLFTVPVTLLFVLVLDLSVAWVFAVLVADEFVKAIPFHRGMASGRWKRRLVVA